MKIYKYIIITKDDKCVLKHYQTLSGAKGYYKKLSYQDKDLVKIIELKTGREILE